MGKNKKFLPKFLLVLSIALVLSSVFLFGKDAYNSYATKNKADTAAAKAIEINKTYTSKIKILDGTSKEELGRKIVENLREVYGSKKVIALIESPVLVSAYPIIGSDNKADDDYWLRHNFDGQWVWEGELFSDYNVAKDFSSWNTTIFGHRMKNGQMFGSFKNFENQESFDKAKSEGKDIFTITSAQGKKDYKIASVIMRDFYDRSFFRVEEDKEWLQQALDDSVIDTNYSEEALYADHYLTLSTCTEASGPNRTIVICYEIDSAKRNLEKHNKNK